MDFDLPDGATIKIGRTEPGQPAIVKRRGANGVYELRVPSAEVSAEHAEIHLGEDFVTVCDLGSKNGTFLQLPPGQRRRCTERFLVGPNATIELRHAVLSEAEEATPDSPEALRRHVATALGLPPESVRLVRSVPQAPDAPRTVLPLSSGETLLVEWPEATLDSNAVRWLRSVVREFNLRRWDERARWSFTAESPRREAVLKVAKRAAPFEAPVLLLGSPGSGKGVLARDLHDHSLRAKGAFVRVNCAAIPEMLFESLMFGHAQGAFTGATRPSVGFVEQAEGGTLFLDEVGELSLVAQAKLLQLLDSGEYYPVGSARGRRADVRIIAATNRDLEEMIPSRFREDLFYRLAEISLLIPDPGPEDFRAAVPALLAEIATKNRMTVMRDEVRQLSDLSCNRAYAGHFRQLRATLVRYLLLRDPAHSAEETWRAAAEAKEVPLEAMVRTPEPAPLEMARFVRALEGLLRLQLARESSSVSELAARLDRTPAAMYAWLARAGIPPQQLGDTEVVCRAIEGEVASLSPYGPFIEWLFRK